MRAEQRIAAMIEPTVTGMGFELVRVTLSGSEQLSLQIMVEPPDPNARMRVDDCAAVSRALSAVLDVEDPVGKPYTLEVSSPGLDRPLTRAKDYDRFAGLEARIELAETMQGRRRFKGRLGGLTQQGAVKLAAEDADYEIPFDAIEKAKLVLNDELLALAEEPERQ
ncbi:MAG: ribosome maturation factor RimP [Rhodospirillales bacterium]